MSFKECMADICTCTCVRRLYDSKKREQREGFDDAKVHERYEVKTCAWPVECLRHCRGRGSGWKRAEGPRREGGGGKEGIGVGPRSSSWLRGSGRKTIVVNQEGGEREVWGEAYGQGWFRMEGAARGGEGGRAGVAGVAEDLIQCQVGDVRREGMGPLAGRRPWECKGQVKNGGRRRRRKDGERREGRRAGWRESRGDFNIGVRRAADWLKERMTRAGRGPRGQTRHVTDLADKTTVLAGYELEYDDMFTRLGMVWKV